MKRLLSFSLLILLAVTSLVLAQSSNQGILRTAAGDRPITVVQQSGQDYISAADALAALGGTLTPDGAGWKVQMGEAAAAFGTDSRYGVVRDDLIEMPVPPIVIEGQPFVPWQFFQGLLRKSSNLDVSFDAATRVMSVRPAAQNAVSIQPSVANVQGISKIVLTLSGTSEYAIVKEPQAYAIRFKSPVIAPFAEQTYEDPHVTRLAFVGNDLRIELTAPDVVGDAYQLTEPFRIVLDLRKAAAPIPGAPTPTGLRPVDQPGIRTIVIDPGHGGKEVGALGTDGLMEKDLTLSIAKKLSAALAAKTGARVILTRDDDSLVSLDQRTAIANQYHADLFLSVHLNAAVVKGAQGSETYYLSLEASDELARRAAETENASATAAGPNPSADLKLILWDLAQQEYINESARFAQAVQEEMSAATGVANRGVKQAPFKVLVGATMPAALVEVGFISNPDEEAKLKTDAFQATIVEAITRAVQRYKTDYETRIGIVQPAPKPVVGGGPAATATAAPPPARPPAPAAPTTTAPAPKRTGT